MCATIMHAFHCCCCRAASRSHARRFHTTCNFRFGLPVYRTDYDSSAGESFHRDPRTPSSVERNRYIAFNRSRPRSSVYVSSSGAAGITQQASSVCECVCVQTYVNTLGDFRIISWNFKRESPLALLHAASPCRSILER